MVEGFDRLLRLALITLKALLRVQAAALSGFGVLFGVSFDGGHRGLLQTYARNAR